jgi:hypothetical protein
MKIGEAWLAFRLNVGGWTQRTLTQAVNRLGIRGAQFIHPHFQFRMIGFVLSVAGTALVLTYLGIKVMFWKTYSIMTEEGLSWDHPVYRFIVGQEQVMFSIYSFVAVLTLIVAFVWGLLYSHRIVGPIYRMRNHLMEAASGRAAKSLKFRENDFFQDLADAYNEELYARGRLKRPGSHLEREFRENQTH